MSFRDLSHPSNALHPLYAPYIAPDVSAPSSDPATIAAHIDNLTIDGIVRNYPLRFAVENIKDLIVGCIILLHEAYDHASIHRPFSSGQLPIEAAAQKRNMDAVRTLLELGAMKGVRDAQSMKEIAATCHSEPKCTCGACAGDWLSKRMRFRLKFHAALLIETMESELNSQFEEGVAHPDPLSLCNLIAYHLPDNLHSSVFKSFYLGYQSIFRTIERFLVETDLPLSSEAIEGRAREQPGVQFYFDKGGEVGYAFDAVTDVAMVQFKEGESEKVLKGSQEYRSLPKCANDLDFRMVRWKLDLEDVEVEEGGSSDEDDDSMDSSGEETDVSDEEDENMFGV